MVDRRQTSLGAGVLLVAALTMAGACSSIPTETSTSDSAPADLASADPAPSDLVSADLPSTQPDRCQELGDWITGPHPGEDAHQESFEVFITRIAPDLEAEAAELSTLFARVDTSESEQARERELIDSIDAQLHDACGLPIYSAALALLAGEGAQPDSFPCFEDQGAAPVGGISLLRPRFLAVDCETRDHVRLSVDGEWLPVDAGPEGDPSSTDSNGGVGSSEPLEVTHLSQPEVDDRPFMFLPDTYPGVEQLYEDRLRFDLLGYLLEGSPEVSEVVQYRFPVEPYPFYYIASFNSSEDRTVTQDLASSQMEIQRVAMRFDGSVEVEAVLYVNPDLGWAMCFGIRDVFFQPIGTMGYPSALVIECGH